MAKLSKSNFHIDLTMSVAKTIDSYFSNAKEAIAAHEEYLHRFRSLDYLKMRGFLRTSFNTLQEIDRDFMSSKVLQISKKMELMGETYDDFFIKSKIGMYSYERIFLNRQLGYTASEGRLRHNSDEISYLRSAMKEVAENINQQKTKVESLAKGSPAYESEEMELKHLKRRENNILTRYGQLVEENSVLSDVIMDFKDAHHEEFSTLFTSYIRDVQPKLLTILNAMAFEFEIVLWHKAKDSQIIREFFKNANAGDVVSSKTYLRYFLKTLDDTKLTKENKELQELLKQVSKVRVVKVLLCIPIIEDLEAFEAALVADASGFEITKCADARCALKTLLKEQVDILVLDTEIESEALAELVKQYRESAKKRKIVSKVILMASDIDEVTMATAQQLKADSLIEREMEPVEIIDTVYALLKKQNSDTH